MHRERRGGGSTRGWCGGGGEKSTRRSAAVATVSLPTSKENFERWRGRERETEVVGGKAVPFTVLFSACLRNVRKE